MFQTKGFAEEKVIDIRRKPDPFCLRAVLNTGSAVDGGPEKTQATKFEASAWPGSGRTPPKSDDYLLRQGFLGDQSSVSDLVRSFVACVGRRGFPRANESAEAKKTHSTFAKPQTESAEPWGKMAEASGDRPLVHVWIYYNRLSKHTPVQPLARLLSTLSRLLQ